MGNPDRHKIANQCSGVDSPYSTEGYSRNGRWANSEPTRQAHNKVVKGLSQFISSGMTRFVATLVRRLAVGCPEF